MSHNGKGASPASRAPGPYAVGLGDRCAAEAPLFRCLLVDECLPGSVFRSSKTRVQVITASDLSLDGKDDGEISRAAQTHGAAVVTCDRTFHYEAACRSAPPSLLFVVDGSMSWSAESIRGILAAVDCFYDSSGYWPREQAKTTYVRVSDDRYSVREMEFPQALVCQLLSRWKRGSVGSADLAALWKCTVPMARRRAARFSEAGWLSCQRRNGRWVYLWGQRLRAYRDMVCGSAWSVRVSGEGQSSS